VVNQHLPEQPNIWLQEQQPDIEAMQYISAEDLANAERFDAFCPVYKIDSKRIVKTGDSTRIVGAETMKFVRENTTIPVPEVYSCYKYDKTGRVRIVMDYVEGEKLEKCGLFIPIRRRNPLLLSSVITLRITTSQGYVHRLCGQHSMRGSFVRR
jgi:hypothetical protein